MDLNPDTLTGQEALVDRLRRRMPEPHRSSLFNLLEKRIRQVLSRVPSDRDAQMAEMYLIGIHDGSNMQKTLASIGQDDALRPR